MKGIRLFKGGGGVYNRVPVLFVSPQTLNPKGTKAMAPAGNPGLASPRATTLGHTVPFMQGTSSPLVGLEFGVLGFGGWRMALNPKP